MTQSVLAAASDSDWHRVEPRYVAIQVVDLHILSFIDDLSTCSLTRINEIFRHFSLTIQTIVYPLPVFQRSLSHAAMHFVRYLTYRQPRHCFVVVANHMHS